MEDLKVLNCNELFSLVETTVVDMRKNFQKAVLSVIDTGPKDETTAFPYCCIYFYFPFFFLNESTAIHLLPYCCTVKSNCSE